MNDPPAGPIDLPAEWAEAPDLPPDWLATLDAVIRRGGGAHAGDKSDPFALSRAARFFGVAAEMCPGKDEDGRDRWWEGWVQRWTDGSGAVHWTLTPYAARTLGYVLVERAEGEPVWVRHDLDAAPHPDPPLVTTLHPRERRLPDASWLNVPDPHSDPARAEARRRNAPRRLNRRQRREIREQRRAERERKAG
jgi:hypothetical protein